MTRPDDLDLTTTCYHEAGHALMAHLLGGEVVRVTIEGDDDEQVGHTAVRWSGLDAGEVRRRSALVALAGPVAEQHWQRHPDDDVAARMSRWRADWDEVEPALADAASARERDRRLRGWLTTVRAELTGPVAWEVLCRLADQLEAHGTLEREQVADTLDGR